jgi:hypothetical protein
MKSPFFICALCIIISFGMKAQSPSSQSFVFAGYPAVGFDYAKKIGNKKWSSQVLSFSVSPSFYFRRYNFDFSNSDSKFRNYRMLMPVTLRFDFYPNLILDKIGKGKRLVGLHIDAGYCLSYTIQAHLVENFYSGSSNTPAFTFDGDIAGSRKFTFHPTVAFGMKVGRVSFFVRFIAKPYPWKDLSKTWKLPDQTTSYFYSWENTQPGAMICLGYML